MEEPQSTQRYGVRHLLFPCVLENISVLSAEHSNTRNALLANGKKELWRAKHLLLNIISRLCLSLEAWLELLNRRRPHLYILQLSDK